MLNQCIALQTQMQQMVAQGEADAQAAVNNRRACDSDSTSCKDVCSRLEHSFVRCSIDKVGSWFQQTLCKVSIFVCRLRICHERTQIIYAKDCYNWGVANCGRPLKTSKCIERPQSGLGVCLLHH